jgi:hypothetical protein
MCKKGWKRGWCCEEEVTCVCREFREGAQGIDQFNDGSLGSVLNSGRRKG